MPPSKVCPQCETIVHLRLKVCKQRRGPRVCTLVLFILPVLVVLGQEYLDGYQFAFVLSPVHAAEPTSTDEVAWLERQVVLTRDVV